LLIGAVFMSRAQDGGSWAMAQYAYGCCSSLPAGAV
jgi:hypothetical protein